MNIMIKKLVANNRVTKKLPPNIIFFTFYEFLELLVNEGSNSIEG
jgi:hypothetical protein